MITATRCLRGKENLSTGKGFESGGVKFNES